MNSPKKRLKVHIIQSIVMLLTAIAILSTVYSVKLFAQGTEGTPAIEETVSSEQAEVTKYGFLAAAIAFGLGAIGAGIAISHVGAAAMGAVAEKPEVAGQALIFVALAEGLVIFGFITALMILGKV